MRLDTFPALATAMCLALLLATPTRADDAPAATIQVAAATAGSSLGGRLVQGVMMFEGREYLLTLRGVEGPGQTKGSVPKLLRARDIEGIYQPTDQGLRNASGVTIRFDPPLTLSAGKLEIELLNRIQPKVSGGHRESGVE